jgi:hypothetical protein
MAVTNPGRVNSGWTVGVDISANSYNQIADLNFFGSLNSPGFTDLAPQINVFGGRTNLASSGGGALAVGHSFEHIFTETWGLYDVVLYGYEQADFHNSQFQVDGQAPLLPCICLLPIAQGSFPLI